MFKKGISEASWCVQKMRLPESSQVDGRLKFHQSQPQPLLDEMEVFRQLGGGVHAHLEVSFV